MKITIRTCTHKCIMIDKHKLNAILTLFYESSGNHSFGGLGGLCSL